MNVALFVEGSTSPLAARQKEPLDRIWGEHLVSLAGRDGFVAIYPISKQNIEQLDPKRPRVSGKGEALDQIIARRLKESRAGFEAAIVAFDLVQFLKPEPRLVPAGCRWLETRWIMRRLASSSSALPDEWRRVAVQRSRDYEQRTFPSNRCNQRRLLKHEIRLLCMEPEFESLLLHERELREILGVKGKSAKGWPRDWIPTDHRRGKEILQDAIDAAHQVGFESKLQVRGKITINAPNEWAEWFLRKLMEVEAGRQKIASHAIVRRLADLLQEPD